MTYENFLRHFYIIDRTRIFTDDWKVTQQWTSVNVPPIGEYLDTHFVMTLTEAGAVVLVLCQVTFYPFITFFSAALQSTPTSC